MTDQRAFTELLDGVLSGRVNRRDMMKRATALGLSASAVSTLVAWPQLPFQAPVRSPAPRMPIRPQSPAAHSAWVCRPTRPRSIRRSPLPLPSGA